MKPSMTNHKNLETVDGKFKFGVYGNFFTLTREFSNLEFSVLSVHSDLQISDHYCLILLSEGVNVV